MTIAEDCREQCKAEPEDTVHALYGRVLYLAWYGSSRQSGIFVDQGLLALSRSWWNMLWWKGRTWHSSQQLCGLCGTGGMLCEPALTRFQFSKSSSW
nr:hypothetical protein CFP56_79180 [Quercus suber]